MDELVRIAGRIATNAGVPIEDIINAGTLASDRQLPPPEWIGVSPAYPRDRDDPRSLR
jgi:hypothetical protein